MTPFLSEQTFLLDTEAGQKLYHQYAQGMPIADYHCHIDPKRFGRTGGSTTWPKCGWEETTTSGG